MRSNFCNISYHLGIYVNRYELFNLFLVVATMRQLFWVIVINQTNARSWIFIVLALTPIQKFARHDTLDTRTRYPYSSEPTNLCFYSLMLPADRDMNLETTILTITPSRLFYQQVHVRISSNKPSKEYILIVSLCSMFIQWIKSVFSYGKI